MTHTQPQPYASETQPSQGWAGWVVFAAVMLCLVGSLNFVQGLIALFDDGYFVLRREDDLLLVDYTVWGIFLLLWGALLVCAGLALTRAKTWARWLAVAAAFVNVIFQMGFLSSFPIFSAIMIGIDVIVIFALTVRWSEARAAM
jgi:hypothetical protein